MTDSSSNLEHYFTAKPKSKPRLGLIRTCLRKKPFEFMTASGVFSKDRVDLGTRLLIDSMVLPDEGCVLDLGCGYGAVGIAVAALNSRLSVFMVDVNIRAVRLAKKNVEINSVRNAIVRRGSLYEPVKDLLFNCVLSNPPVSAGMNTVKAMVCETPCHMVDGASFQMVVRSKIAGSRFCKLFEDAFGNVSVLARGSGYRVLLSQKH